MDFHGDESLCVEAGEGRLLAILRQLRSADVTSGTECRLARNTAKRTMIAVEMTLRRRRDSGEPMQTTLQVEMEYCMQLYRRILYITAQRIIESLPYSESLTTVSEVGVQVGEPGVELSFSCRQERKDVETGMDSSDSPVNRPTTVAGSVVEDVIVLDDIVSDEEEQSPSSFGECGTGDRPGSQGAPRSHDRMNERPEVDAYRCWVCKSRHQLHVCPRFMLLSRRCRYELLRDRGFKGCHNCYSLDHRAEKCTRQDGCRCNTHVCQCGRGHRHNSTICGGKRRVY